MALSPVPQRESLFGWGLATALFVAGMALMFRFLPGGSIGDNGDGLIAIATLEHWYRVGLGQAADWRSPGWFWPTQGAIGLTDCFALMALPYSAARLLGVAPFGSMTAVVASLATGGFWGMVLLQRSLRVPAAIGGVMAFVFAFGAVATFQLGHVQTYAIMLAPWIGMGLLWGWRVRGPGGAVLAGLAGLLFGLMTLTAPQTGWFLSMEAGAALVLSVLFGGWAGPRAWRERPVWPVLLGLVVGLAVGIAPIPIVYAAGLGHKRAWSEVAFYLPRLGDILNVPTGDLLWGEVLQRLGLAGSRPELGAEVRFGFTPVLALCGVVGLVGLAFIPAAGERAERAGDRVAAAFLVMAVLAWLASVDWGGGVSLWHVVWRRVPLAASIRTPFRLQLASYFFVLLALGHVFARGLQGAARWGRTGWAAALGGALALIAVEQLGPPPTARHTWTTGQWLVAAHRPDFPCRAFYVLPAKAAGPEVWYEYVSEAMLLSAWLGMPTINGDASWVPAGWDLLMVDRPDYAEKALDWIGRNGVGDQVCGLEVRTGRWVQGLGPLVERAQ